MKRVPSVLSLIWSFGLLSHLVYASHELDSCPGYRAEHVRVKEFALTAELVLAGEPCAVYGKELERLSFRVRYETGQCCSSLMSILREPTSLRRRTDTY